MAIMSGVYDQDGLKMVHNHVFMHDPRFRRAYERGGCCRFRLSLGLAGACFSCCHYAHHLITSGYE